MVAFRDQLASVLGLVLIDVESLLVMCMENRSYIGLQIAELKLQGQQVPSSLISDAIKERLERIDCKVNGCVVDMKDLPLDPITDSNFSEPFFHIGVTFNKGATDSTEGELDSRFNPIPLIFQKIVNLKESESTDNCVVTVFHEISHFYE